MKVYILTIFVFVTAAFSAHGKDNFHLGTSLHKNSLTTSIVQIYNDLAPISELTTLQYCDSLISIESPKEPLVINIKLNENLSEEEQDFARVMVEEGEGVFLSDLFEDTLISILGYFCYQLNIPMEVRFYSKYNPNGYRVPIGIDILRMNYDPFNRD